MLFTAGILHSFPTAARSIWPVALCSLFLGNLSGSLQASKHQKNPSFSPTLSPSSDIRGTLQSYEQVSQTSLLLDQRPDVQLLTPPPSPVVFESSVNLASTGSPISKHPAYKEFDDLIHIFQEGACEIAIQLVINQELMAKSRDIADRVIREKEQTVTHPPAGKISRKRSGKKTPVKRPSARSPPTDMELARAHSIKASLALIVWAQSVQNNAQAINLPSQFRQFLETAFGYHPETTLRYLHCWLGQWYIFRRKTGPGGMPVFPPSWLRLDAAFHHFQQVYQLSSVNSEIVQPAVFWIEALLHLGLIPGLERAAILSWAPAALQKTRMVFDTDVHNKYPGLFAPVFFSHMEQTPWYSVRPEDPALIVRLIEEVEWLEAGLTVTKELEIEERFFFEGKHAVKVSALLAHIFKLSEYQFIKLTPNTSHYYFVDHLKDIVLRLSNLTNIKKEHATTDKKNASKKTVKKLAYETFINELENQSCNKLHPQAQALMLAAAALLLYQQADCHNEAAKAAGLYFRAVEKGFFHEMALSFRPKLQKYLCYEALAKVYEIAAPHLYTQCQQRGFEKSLPIDVINIKHYAQRAREFQYLAEKQEKEKIEQLQEELGNLLSPPPHKHSRSGRSRTPPRTEVSLKRSLSADITCSPVEGSMSRAGSDIDIARLNISSPYPRSPQTRSSTQSLHSSGRAGSKRSICDISEAEELYSGEWETVEYQHKRIKSAACLYYTDKDPRLDWNWTDEVKKVWKLALAYRRHELFGDPLTDQIRHAAVIYGLDEITILKGGIECHKQSPGVEVLYEELAWALMHRLDDPALHSHSISASEQRNLKLAEARVYLATALEQKTRQEPGSIALRFSQSDFLPFITQLITLEKEKFPDSLQFHFMKGVRCIVSSLGHNYSYLSEYGNMGQRIMMSQVAAHFFQMKTLCPPDPEYTGAARPIREEVDDIDESTGQIEKR